MEMNSKQFFNLVHKEGENLITIYLSTHRFGQEVNIKKDALQLKVMMKEIEEQLSKRGKNDFEVRAMLSPLIQLIEDHDLWHNQLGGLAIFLSNGSMEKYNLPVSFETSYYISRHFNVKPLVSLFNSSAMFYLTKITKNHIQFYLCDMFRIREVKFEEDFPDTMDKALSSYDPVMSMRIRSGHAGANPTLQGQGTVREDDQIKLRKFYERFDAHLLKMIGPKQIPMVLAGQNHLTSIYKGASKYPAIVPETFNSDPNATEIKELHKAAYAIARESLAASQQRAFDRYQKMAGTEKVSDNITKIVTAAFYKDVDVLFVEEGKNIWGKISCDCIDIERHKNQQFDSEELINFSIIHTLRNGGEVYVVPKEQMPLPYTEAATLLRASVVSAI